MGRSLFFDKLQIGFRNELLIQRIYRIKLFIFNEDLCLSKITELCAYCDTVAPLLIVLIRLFFCCFQESFRRMEENGSCDLTCIASIVVVGLMWGATNPFLRMASASTASNVDKNRGEWSGECNAVCNVQCAISECGLNRLSLDVKQSATSVCSRMASFIGSFILLLLDWRFSLPFALNQLASVSLPISYSFSHPPRGARSFDLVIFEVMAISKMDLSVFLP